MKVNKNESPLDVFASGAKKHAGGKNDRAQEISAPPRATAKAPLSRKQGSEVLAKSSQAAEVNNKEIVGMLNRIYAMRTDIDSKIQALSHTSGLSVEQILAIAHNQKSFPPQKLKALEQEAEAFAQKVWSIQNKQGPANQGPANAKQRKSKLVGARRHWINTR